MKSQVELQGINSPEMGALIERLTPDPAHQFLLDAALLPDDRAIESWSSRYQLSGLECADDGEFQLLPLVYSNLRKLAYTGPEMTLMQGAFRQAWYRNQLLLEAAIGVMARFSEARIASLIIGGLPLTFGAYPSQSLRTLRQADLLVDASQLETAVESIVAQGWELRPAKREFPSAADLRYGHAAVFYRVGDAARERPTTPPGGTNSDAVPRLCLHWRLLNPGCILSQPTGQSGPTGLPTGREVKLQGRVCRVLDTETCLIEACMSAFPHEPEAMPWVADAFMILQSANLAWPRVVSQAIEDGIALPMLIALGVLAKCTPAEIPSSALEALTKNAFNPADIAAMQGFTAPFEARTLSQRLEIGLRVYRRGRPGSSRLGHLPSLPGFLNYYWGPGRMIRRLIRSLT